MLRILMLFCVLGLTACAGTRYTEVRGTSFSLSPGGSRDVFFRVGPELARHYPSCFVLAPGSGQVPDEVQRTVRMHARDVLGPETEDCHWVLSIDRLHLGGGDMVLAAGRFIGMRLVLWRKGTDVPLWVAVHRGVRMEGGIPVGPVSALIQLGKTEAFRQDQEHMLSLLHDVVRRLFAAFPENRIRQRPGQQLRLLTQESRPEPPS